MANLVYDVIDLVNLIFYFLIHIGLIFNQLIPKRIGTLGKLGSGRYQFRTEYNVIRLLRQIGNGTPQIGNGSDKFFAFHLTKQIFNFLYGFILSLIKTLPSRLHTILCIQKGISHLTDLSDIGTFSDLKPVCISSISGRIKGIGNDNLLSRIPCCRRIRKVMCGRIKG